MNAPVSDPDADALNARLSVASARLDGFQVMLSFGEVLRALEDAARAGVTLTPAHLAHLSHMHAFYQDAYPSSCVTDVPATA